MDAVQQSIYKYRPLASGEIRLLRLQPSNKDAASPILCLLEHHEIHQHSDFEAVSYVWGDQSVKHNVSIDDASQYIAVGQNCWNLLSHFRLPDQERLLWIDALCINQEDRDEKSRQVPWIGHIYATARKTLVFLQEATPEMLKCRQHKTNADSGVTGLDDEAKRSLFENPWFRRVWIIQEVLLSGSKQVHCPPFEWDWEQLREMGKAAVMEMNDTYWYHRSMTDFWLVGGMQKQTPGMLNKAYALDFLIGARDFGHTEYHDKFYSLLSLFEHPLDIVPDYHRSKEQVHRDFTRALIHAGESRFWYSTHRSSWIPDWDNALHDLVGDDSRSLKRFILFMMIEENLVTNLHDPDDGDCFLHRYAFRIGHVNQVSTAKLLETSEDSMITNDEYRAAGCKSQWDELMKEFNLDIKDDETGALPVVHIHRRNHAALDWFRGWMDNIEYPVNSDAKSNSGQSHSSEAESRCINDIESIQDSESEDNRHEGGIDHEFRQGDHNTDDCMHESSSDHGNRCQEDSVESLEHHRDTNRTGESDSDIEQRSNSESESVAASSDSFNSQRVAASESLNEHYAKHATSLKFCKDMRLFKCGDDNALGIGPEDVRVGDEVWYIVGLNCPVCVVRPLTDEQVAVEGQSEGYLSEGSYKVTLVGLAFLGSTAMQPAFGEKTEFLRRGGSEGGGPQILEIH